MQQAFFYQQQTNLAKRTAMSEKSVISFSGGLGSFLSAYLLRDKDCELVFCDTLTEDPDLYRFIDEVAEKLKLPLIKLRDGRDVWQVFEDVKFIGNSRIAPCSKELKTKPFRKYLKENYKPEDCILILGFSGNELHRLERAKKNWQPYKVDSVIKDLIFTRDAALKALKELDIRIPKLYELGFEHNNCGGFCVRAGTAQFRKLYKEFPERYKHHAEQEQRLLNIIPTTKPFLRKTINSKLNYITLKDFEAEAKTCQLDLNYGGCGCFDDELNEENHD